MSNKAWTLHGDKTGPKPQSAQPAIDGLDHLALQPADRATLIKRARHDPSLKSSGDVRQLQRAIGNQAVSRLLAEVRPVIRAVGAAPIAQRTGDEKELQAKPPTAATPTTVHITPLMQRRLLVNGNPASAVFLRAKRAEIIERQAERFADLTPPEWDVIFDGLVRLAEHELDFEHARMSDHIADIRALGVDQVIANRLARTAPPSDDEADDQDWQAQLEAARAMSLGKKGQKGLEKKLAEPSTETARATTFPHKGKHCPQPSSVEKPAKLISDTAEKGKAAVYRTNDPTTVVGWEATARANGLLLSDNFTVVHVFATEIGADQGEMTRFIRIDGDHGHPISETKGKQSFDAYILKDIELANSNGDQERLQEIFDWLKANAIAPGPYFKKVKKDNLPQ